MNNPNEQGDQSKNQMEEDNLNDRLPLDIQIERMNPEDIDQEIEIDKNAQFNDEEDMIMEEGKEEVEIDFYQEYPDFKAPGEIYSIALDQEKGIAILGDSEENTIFFDIPTKKVINTLHINKDSVNFLKFTCDNKYLISASIDGTLHIFDAKNNYNLIQTIEDQDTEIQWIDIHPKGPCFSLGAADGSVWVYIINNKNDNFNFFSHIQSCTCGGFVNQGKNLVSASEDMSFKIYDLKNQKILATIKGNKYHQSPILSMAIAQSKPIAATGSESGELGLVNYENGNILYLNNHFDGDDKPIETISFCNKEEYICFANLNAKVFIFDLSSICVRSIIRLEDENILKMVPSVTNCFEIFSSGDNGNFYMLDVRGNGSVVLKERCHTDTIIDFVVTQNEKFILTSSWDKTINLVKIVTIS